jgi:hypothetical protein
MKKFLVVLGMGVGLGFVLGSRAGREPYERLEAKVKEISSRDDVTAATEKATAVASELKDKAVSAGAEKVAEVSDKVDGAVNGGSAVGSAQQRSASAAR